MTCSRLNCENIMCDTYIPEIGYICNECKEEFKRFLEKTGNQPKTDMEIKAQLSQFMQTEFVRFDGIEISIDDFFREYTK